MNGLEQEEVLSDEASFCESPGVSHKWTVILLDGRRVRIQLWDTSGQGRFSTIIRSYSRGAQGILLVYDITNKWSFNGLNRWLQEVREHAPGIPMILMGNRLHLAFKRQISEQEAEKFSHKHNMSFFEVSPLCNFNVRESFAELARVVLQRHGMDCLWRHCVVPSLQELCCRAIVRQTTCYGIEQLPLPATMKSCLKSFSTHSASPSGLTIKPCFSIYDAERRSTQRPGQGQHAEAEGESSVCMRCRQQYDFHLWSVPLQTHFSRSQQTLRIGCRSQCTARTSSKEMYHFLVLRYLLFSPSYFNRIPLIPDGRRASCILSLYFETSKSPAN